MGISNFLHKSVILSKPLVKALSSLNPEGHPYASPKNQSLNLFQNFLFQTLNFF